MKKKENSERYNSFMIALVVIISISFIYMYYAFVVSPTGLASFNETSGETNFPPVWSYNETVFRINKNAALVLNLDDYFSDQENDVLSYLATQPSSFSVVIEGNILTAQPEQNFFGERDMIISASDDYNLVSQEVRIIVEETSASFNEGASIQDKDNKFVGKKVVDEVEFETYFNYIVKNETGLFLSFYHDSLEPQPVWIEGNVSYELSQNVSLLNENVTLVVFRNNDVVPKFKLHVGVTSEIFEFGKEIPEVSINEGVAHSIVNFSFIDRDDELLDVAVSQRVAHALIKGINVSEVRVMIGESSETVLNTEVFAAEPIDMESAEISLPKNSDINAIMECTDFDLDSFSCNGLWINSGLSFTQNETHIFFTVSHFSGYGGADIEILTVQSYPMVGSIWTVAFNVSGTANLTITAEEDTVFGTDLIFLSLMCGDDVVDASYDGTTVFYENFNCSTTAYEKSTVLTEGRHVLKFLFGEEEDYAYNSAYSGTNSLSTANHSFHGEASGDMAGYSVAPGDFNGDGIKDLLIGAPGYNSGGTTHAGKAYVVLGPFPRYSWNLSNANASWIGANASDEAGWSVAAGDINGDSYDDVIIGAPGYDYDTGPFPATRGLNVGRVYLFYGSEDISGNYNLSNVSGANGFNASFMGQNQSDAAGWSLAVGELSGDTEEDIVVGAYLFQDSGGNQLGRVYSVFGAPGLYGNFELADANASFIGESAADWFGYSMAIGDVTGDTKNDLIIGAPKFDKPVMADEGRVYILNGSLSNDMNLGGVVTDYSIGNFWGEGDTSNLGFSLDAGGDVNNDSITDFLVGAYLDDSAGVTNGGKVYLVYGRSAAGFLDVTGDEITLAANASWYGDNDNDENGYSVGIINLLNDSYADVAFSSYNRSDVGGTLAGRFFVVYGQSVTASLNQKASSVNASWYSQYQGATGPIASGSFVMGSFGESGEEITLDEFGEVASTSLVSETGVVYILSDVQKGPELEPTPEVTPSVAGGGRGSGGGPGPVPTQGICLREPIIFNAAPPIRPGDTVPVTITTGITSGTFAVPAFGYGRQLSPWEAQINGAVYTWNFLMEVPSIVSGGVYQAFFTQNSETACGNPLTFRVEPSLCQLPANSLSAVTWEDTNYASNFVVPYAYPDKGTLEIIGSTRLIPSGNNIAVDYANIPSEISVVYCDGKGNSVTVEIPFTTSNSYFGDTISYDFIVNKCKAEAATVAGVISSPADVWGSNDVVSGSNSNVFTAGAVAGITGSAVSDMSDSASNHVPQVFGGGTGSTLFSGSVNLPESAFDHPIGVKVEYPNGNINTGVTGSSQTSGLEGILSAQELAAVQKAMQELPPPTFVNKPSSAGAQAEMMHNMYQSYVSSRMPGQNPQVSSYMGRIQGVIQNFMSGGSGGYNPSGKVVADVPSNSITGGVINSITGMASTDSGGSDPTAGLPPGFIPVGRSGSEKDHELGHNVYVCSPDTPVPIPPTSPTPGPIAPGTVPIAVSQPEPISDSTSKSTPGSVNYHTSPDQSTPSGQSTKPQITPEIALLMRFVGTGVWGGTFGAGTWIDTINAECGGGVGFAPSQPAKPKEQTPSPPEPEVETPGETGEPAALPTAGDTGETGGRIGVETPTDIPVGNQGSMSTEPISAPTTSAPTTGPAVLPISGDSGETGGRTTPGSAAIVDIQSNKAFWIWLWSLF